MSQLISSPSDLRAGSYSTSERRALEPLPYPVYFVTKDPKWQDLLNNPVLPPIEPLLQKSTTANDIWSAQTYIALKQRGLNVHLVDRPIPGKICVFPYFYLNLKDLPFNCFAVACQLDSPRPEICEHRIVLNELRVRTETDHFVPHFPQPNLLPRDPSRGTKVENLVFKGQPYNLAEPFTSDEFLAKLQELNIKLVTKATNPIPTADKNLNESDFVSETQFDYWRDYTQADVVLAVRDLTKFDIGHKPALKLINAWLAGCPAILGPEPAYQAVRQSDLDYIEVRTPEEAIAALKRLQESPKLYSAMVENGRQRVQEFTVDQTALYWRNLLAGPIAAGYEKWLRQSPLQKTVGRPIQFIQRSLKHKAELKLYFTNIQQGPRILSDAEG